MIILSSLGVGTYREARYKSEHHDEVVTTGFFATVLHRWHPEAKVKILATEAAKRSQNGQYLQEHHPDFELVAIPEGKTEAEAWALFEKIADPTVLPPGENVIFDITHGLRSLPMLGFLALSYLRVVRNITIEKVYYGALELTPRAQPAIKCECCGQSVRQEEEEKQTTPVVDLTPLVNLLDWVQAANRFLDTGDARKISRLMGADADLEGFTQPLERVSASLAFQRPLETGKNAYVLHEELKKLQPHNIQQSQLVPILEHIEERFAGMAYRHGDLGTNPEGVLRGQYAQIRFYVRGGQFAQAVELLYEWLRSVYFWSTGVLAGEKLWLGNHRNNKKIPKPGDLSGAEWTLFHNLNGRVSQLRNEFAHFNEFRASLEENVSLHADVGQEIFELTADIPAAVRPLGLELNPQSPTQPQREAAP